MDVRTRGANCPTAGAIVPMHDGTCDWCGKSHRLVYVWSPPAGWKDTRKPVMLIDASGVCHATPLDGATQPLCGARPWSWSIVSMGTARDALPDGMCPECRRIAEAGE